MADHMNVTVRDPLAPRRQMPPIVIGRAGEYGATTVTFDLRGLIDRYGAGVPTLLHKRPPDDEAYIVPPSAADTETHDRTEMPDSETLVWHVGQVATSYVGNGKIELQWHPVGAAKKSAQFDVVVLGTIGNPVSEIPDAQQIYLDVMQGIADDAEDAADRAEAATEHYPKIENGNWYVWDAANSEWVNTGVSARGPAGDTGDSAYEEAVELGFVGTEAEWLASLKSAKDGTDGVSPAVTVTEIEGGHRVTITDATHPQGQNFAVMNGSGIPEDVKVALLDCFENVAWINDQGQTYYDALYAALYPPKTLVSISAVFTQGSAVIYDTDSLDTLKQYLTVTATYDDSSTGVVTNYTLSGTLTVGTSTITVLYNGKTATFNVTVTEFGAAPSGYTEISAVHANFGAMTVTNITVPLNYFIKAKSRRASVPSRAESVIGCITIDPETGNDMYGGPVCFSATANLLGAYYRGVESFVSGNIYGTYISTTTQITTSKITFSAVIGGTTMQQSANNTIGSNSRDIKNLCLFTSGRPTNPGCDVDLQYVEIYKPDGSTIYEKLIPVVRDSDGAVGFYAAREQRFYTSDTETPYTIAS